MTDAIALLSANYTALHSTGSSPATPGTVQAYLCNGHATHVIAWYVKGANASSSGNIVFTLQVTMDQEPSTADWRTIGTVTVALSGTTQITGATSISSHDLTGWRWVRLASVGNSDGTYDATVNGWIRRLVQ